MATETKVYDVDQVIEVVKMLSQSQGFYGRLLRDIMYMKEYDLEKFEEFKDLIEVAGLKDPVDVVMFFEC